MYNVLFFHGCFQDCFLSVVSLLHVLWSFFWAYLDWVSLKHLELVCQQTWGNFSHNFSNFFFYTNFFLFFFYDFISTNISFFYIVPQIPQNCVFFKLFLLCFSDRIISIHLSLNLLTLSSALPILLLSPPVSFYHFLYFFSVQKLAFYPFFVALLPLLRTSIFPFISRVFAFPAQREVIIAALNFFKFNFNI